ncbi:MAG: acetylesterase [Acetatifactor sp.]|nr:acetylesterase [Acetatifactor sp.]
MAIGTFEFFSDSLKRGTQFRIILPNEADAASEGETVPLKLLILLHGYCGNSGDWLWNSAAVEMAQKYHLCIVLPSGENSFYLDGKETGRQYATYVGQELVRYVRKTFGLSGRREDTFIGGYSMGGFGAIHTALQFHDTFAGAIALSSAMIVYGIGGMKPGDDNGVANYEYYRLMFGDPETVEESGVNPEKLILQIEEKGVLMPKFYLACGEQDFLLQSNRRFEGFLKEHGVEYCYTEGSGEHNFEYWNRHLEPGIRWLLGMF